MKETKINKPNGRIYHNMMGELVIAPSSTAAFSTNAEADNISNDEFHERITRSTDGGPSIARSTKRNSTFKKRYGANLLVVTGLARLDATSGSGSVVTEHNARIYCKVIDQVTGAVAEDYAQIASGIEEQFELSLDISGITDNNLALVEIDCYVDISISGADGSTYDTEMWLREDVAARTAT